MPKPSHRTTTAGASPSPVDLIRAQAGLTIAELQRTAKRLLAESSSPPVDSQGGEDDGGDEGEEGDEDFVGESET